jgi:UDP-glucose 4-epimerase
MRNKNHQKRQIVITGVDGYIGSSLVYYIKEVCSLLDWEIIGIDSANPNTVESPMSYCDVMYRKNVTDSSLAPVYWNADLIIHLAASSLITPSIEEPLSYYQNNIGGTMAVIHWANEGNTPIIFASTAAVYEHGQNEPIKEDGLINPKTSYGASKLICESILRECVETKYIDTATAFRFFNVAGAVSTEFGQETYAPHLMTQICDAIHEGFPVTIYGDGEAIRDFVHVETICQAIIREANLIFDKKRIGYEVYNLGTSTGTKVIDVVNRAFELFETKPNIKFEPPRPGDPTYLVADASKYQRDNPITNKPIDLDYMIFSHYQHYKYVRGDNV